MSARVQFPGSTQNSIHSSMTTSDDESIVRRRRSDASRCRVCDLQYRPYGQKKWINGLKVELTYTHILFSSS